MLGQFSMLQYLEFFARILVACICGACIGFERSKRLKEAGIRTHIIVCCAAALTMLVSKYGFSDLTDSLGGTFNGTRGADPARIAAQIISGVSFLGAGIIFRNGTSIKGLTTAAGIWATAGIGLAIGAGMYVIGAFATGIVAIIQILMHKYTIGVDSMIIGQMHCTVGNPDAFRAALNAYIEQHKVQVVASRIVFDETGGTTYDLTLRMPHNMTINELTGFLESMDDVRAISCELGK